MDHPAGEVGPTLARFRAYLHLLARMHWSPRLQARLDPADVVRQTPLPAPPALGRFRRRRDGELAAGLPHAPARNPAEAARDLGRAKRDVTRARSRWARRSC